MAVIHTAELGPRKWPFPQAPQVNSLVRCSQTAHQYVSLQTGKQKYHVTIHSPKNTNKIAAFKPRPISILLSLSLPRDAPGDSYSQKSHVYSES